jgi:hypothetical protein
MPHGGISDLILKIVDTLPPTSWKGLANSKQSAMKLQARWTLRYVPSFSICTPYYTDSLQTDALVQTSMKNGFKGKTLLCIGKFVVAETEACTNLTTTTAHRLKTIIDYDRIVVMDQGRIAEIDTPISLWNQGGIFRGMCERSGIRREEILRQQ